MINKARAVELLLHCIVGDMKSFCCLPESSKSNLIISLQLLERRNACQRRSRARARTRSIMSLLAVYPKILGCTKHDDDKTQGVAGGDHTGYHFLNVDIDEELVGGGAGDFNVD